MSNCRTCQKLRIPDGSQLSVQLQQSPAPSPVLYQQVCRDYPSQHYCHCGFTHHMQAPQTIVHIGAPTATPSTPTTPGETETPVSCPPVLTISEAFTAPEIDEIASLKVACPNQFGVGGFIVFPGRGYVVVEAVDADILTLTVRNKSVQANFEVPANTRIFYCPDLDDVFRVWYAAQYEDPETTLDGGLLLFLSPNGSITPVKAPAGSWLLGSADGFRLVTELPHFTLPSFQSRANLTATGTIVPDAPETELDIKRVLISFVLRNTHESAAQSFTIGDQAWTVPAGGVLGISRPFTYLGSGSIPVTVPEEDASVTDIHIYGFEVALA